MGKHSSQKELTASQNQDGAVVADVLFGFLGAAGFTEAETAWNVADGASEIYTDRHQTAKQRTNGKVELGVKQTLGPIFCQQTQPEPEKLRYNLPSWMLAPTRQRGMHLA